MVIQVLSENLLSAKMKGTTSLATQPQQKDFSMISTIMKCLQVRRIPDNMYWVIQRIKNDYFKDAEGEKENISKTVSEPSDDEILEIVPPKSRQGYVSETFLVKCRSGSYFVKMPPSNAFMKQMAQQYKMYQVEVKVYNILLPKYLELDSSLSRFLPKYIGGSIDVNDEYLMLENLISKEYKLGDVMQTYSEDKINLVLEAMGKLHALGVIIQEKMSLDDVFPELGEDILIGEGKMPHGVKAFVNYLKSEGVAVPDKLQELHESFWDNWTRLRSREEGDIWTITHGDMWNNNMLFKTTKENDEEKVLDLKLIDWQISRYTSPGIDFSYFTFTCVGYDYIKENFEKMLDVYMTNFYQVFKTVETKIEPPTKESLRHNIEKKMMFGLVSAIQLYPIVFKIKAVDMPTVQDSDDVKKNQENVFGDNEENKFWKDDYPKENITPAIKERILGAVKIAQMFNVV